MNSKLVSCQVLKLELEIWKGLNIEISFFFSERDSIGNVLFFNLFLDPIKLLAYCTKIGV